MDKLRDATQATMETPAIKNRMLEIGVTRITPDSPSPEYLAKFVVDEVARREAPHIASFRGDAAIRGEGLCTQASEEKLAA